MSRNVPTASSATSTIELGDQSGSRVAWWLTGRGKVKDFERRRDSAEAIACREALHDARWLKNHRIDAIMGVNPETRCEYGLIAGHQMRTFMWQSVFGATLGLFGQVVHLG